eukprot:scaffold249640_cov23-Prasinocladus_malaysianus.AAC.1
MAGSAYRDFSQRRNIYAAAIKVRTTLTGLIQSTAVGGAMPVFRIGWLSWFHHVAAPMQEATAIHHSPNPKAEARRLTQAASAKQLKERLLGVEADLPTCAFMCQSSAMWQ